MPLPHFLTMSGVDHRTRSWPMTAMIFLSTLLAVVNLYSVDHVADLLDRDVAATLESLLTDRTELPANATTFFYNLYTPPNGLNRSLTIVEEQLIILGQAETPIKIFYNTIGEPINVDDIDQLCLQAGLVECNHLRHFSEAGEEVTLTAVYQYCQANTGRVGYLHNKGSLHQVAWNGRPQAAWRQSATMAVRHADCLEPPSSRCNVCSLLTTLWPFIHMPGNFFTADCAYIRQLVPPAVFQRRMEQVLEERDEWIADAKLVTRRFADSESALGSGRYANEHWIGSGPEIVPCDLSPTWNIQEWQVGNRTAADFEWDMQPRHPATLPQNLESDQETRLRDYYLLAGNLFKWFRLYERAPPPDSWVYHWFPDGAQWRSGVGRYGAAVVDVLSQWQASDHQQGDSDDDNSAGLVQVQADDDDDSLYVAGGHKKGKTGFEALLTPDDTAKGNDQNAQDASVDDDAANKNMADDDDNVRDTIVMEPDDDAPTNDDGARELSLRAVPGSLVAIFYNIYVSEDMAHVKSIVEDQLGQIGSSSLVKERKVSLFFNTIGTMTTEPSFMEIVCLKNRLQCQFMQHFDSGYEEVTLNRLHQFCFDNVDFSVIYLHSKGSFHQEETAFHSQTNWRRHMTAAVTSDLCREPPDSTCNVCGLLTLPWPTPHFAGNFFTAQCQYVKKLVSPLRFEGKMHKVNAEAMMKRIEHQFTSSLLSDEPYHYALGRFAAEHWITSHPSVSMCDLSAKQDLNYWKSSQERSTAEFDFKMFPRAPLTAAWSYMDAKKLTSTLETKNQRLREYFFLAGLVFRWYKLYEAAPLPDSWVWQWYPDGDVWKDAVAQHAEGAVEQVTQSVLPHV